MLRGVRVAFPIALWAVSVAMVGAVRGVQDVAPAQGVEFFEKKIRPVLVTNCYVCHGPESAVMGGLRLDSKSGILKGGSRGPAMVPGDPANSLLVKAISYKDPHLAMPPTGKLSEEEIADLIAWIAMGAPDPRTQAPSAVAVEGEKGIDFAEGRRFWSFQPVKDYSPPQVQQNDWPTSPLDYFILARLEKKGFSPAPAADRRTWLRRVTFDLIGLPPTPEEIDEFLADESASAFEKGVDRLLASPHYGERWARHWLDVVRYAETNGHEFDSDKLDAWRYRDYVIRAFNADLPYDRFVLEHIAGDLLADPRTIFDGSQMESALGTGFYWFGEVINSPVDSVKSVADQVDNQIDVTSKAFLGLTLACARCHDHKFDPISAADYYAVGGILHSTDIREVSIDSPARIREIAATHGMIANASRRIHGLLQAAWLPLAASLIGYLPEAAKLISSEKTDEKDEKEEAAAIAALAAERGLDAPRLGAWVGYLREAAKDRGHIFYPFAAMAERMSKDGASFVSSLAAVRKELEASLSGEELEQRGDIVFEDFENSNYEGWRVEGQAFGKRPIRQIPPNQTLRGFRGAGAANSFGGGSEGLVGTLTSEKFRMPKLYVHVRMAGTKDSQKLAERAKLRFTIVASGYKSQQRMPDGTGALGWKTARMTKEVGRICFLEIVDRSREGHIAVDKIVFSDSEKPPVFSSPAHPRVRALLEDQGINSLEALSAAYRRMFVQVMRENNTDDGDNIDNAKTQAFLAALSPAGKLEDGGSLLAPSQRESVAQLQAGRRALEAALPASAFGMVSADEDPRNIRIHVRGNHKNLGEEVPRGTLRVVSSGSQEPITDGSGRLQLARWLANSENPLTARVMVNRIWKHHFGQGLVRTADNFGRMGERPTHPELLDFLARRFVESGWSVKAVHRFILLSSTYRMSSRAEERAASIDPENRLLHHMPVKRLEAEAIRDSILAVSGRLDRTLFGPSLVPHISKYQDGRGKPESGPLDADGRRSIYIQVRRNFLTPMFLAFDYPLPISTIGRRSVSTVPSQALLMMNNELVTLGAREWAKQGRASELDSRRRVEKMYVAAFGRLPEDWEVDEVGKFLDGQRARYRNMPEAEAADKLNEQVWADLAHVLFNSAEFIYVR